MLMLFSWAVALFAIVAVYAVLKRNNLTRHENLPPGSMGFPFLGEVRQFFGSSPPCTLSPFMKERIHRYGPIFKTCLLRKPMVVSADPGFNNFVFQQHGRLFKIWCPGASLLLGNEGEEWEVRFHKYLRNLSHALFSPESLKQSSFLSELDRSVAEATLSETWVSGTTLDIKQEIFFMLFNLVAKRLFSYDSSKAGEGEQDLPKYFMDGTETVVSYFARRNSLFNILEGRKKLKKILERKMEERLQSGEARQQKDLLDIVIHELKKDDTTLTKEMGTEIIFLILFVGIQATMTSTLLAVKLLTDHQDVVERLSEEHDRVLSERKDGRSWISWEEYKSMTYTAMVLKEAVRMVTNPIFRQTLQDINIKGYTIPKGWPVLLHIHSVHMDPKLFPDPFSFNPSRWKDAKAGVLGYMPFGGGRTQCLGMDLSKLFMTVFLHHFVTKYRWKIIKGGEVIQKLLTFEFPNGFHIQLSPRKQWTALNGL